VKLTPNDCLCTPAWLWSIVSMDLGRISLDPCASTQSSVEAFNYCYGPHHGDVDGLAIGWPRADDGPVFVNPPYGRGHLRSWARKCGEEAEQGSEVVLLVPCSPDTAWWQICLPSVRAIVYLSERIRFDGGKHGGGTFASALMYWGPRPWSFLAAYQSHGDCRFVR
jgi:hypothetical protein